MKILEMLVEMVRVVYRLAGKVARYDRDMAQQLKRASTSAALNASEGLYARAGSGDRDWKMRSTRRARH